MPTERRTAPDDHWSGSERLLDQLHQRHVVPELERRREQGTWADDGEVERALVVLGGARAGAVLLNSEVRGVLTVKASRPLLAGEDVMPADIRSVEAFAWEDDDGASSFVAVIPTSFGLALITEFRGNVLESAPHLDAAEEFMTSAMRAFENRQIRVFLDLSYSAAELMAKSELLRWAGATVSGSRTHSRVISAYNAWAKLGNTEAKFAALLNRLSELRGPARYLDRDIELLGRDLNSFADDLREMFEHVRAIAPRPGVDPEPSESVPLTMVARRDLLAGELLGSGDLSPFPPRS